MSSEDGHSGFESPFHDSEEVSGEGMFDSMATSMWGDMMREAVDEDDE